MNDHFPGRGKMVNESSESRRDSFRKLANTILFVLLGAVVSLFLFRVAVPVWAWWIRYCLEHG